MKTPIALATVLLLAASPLMADDLPDWVKNTKVGGLVFGDLYYLAQSHDPELEGQTGFWIRRIYLDFDSKITDHWSSRLRFEASHPGDFVTKDKMVPFVKDAWLKFKSGDHSIIAGVQPQPLFDVVESTWGYRPVEKTPQDLFKFGGSRDTGLGYRGDFGEDDMVRLAAVAGNGADVANETDDGKKVGVSLGFFPKNGLIIEVYTDIENRPGDTDRQTYQLFAAFKKEKFRFGLVGTRQKRDVEGADSLDIDVASVFGVVNTGDKGAVLFRYDRMFDAISDAPKIPYLTFSADGEISLAIVGYDIKVHKNISIIPNLEYVTYASVSGVSKPDNEMMVRITGFWKF